MGYAVTDPKANWAPICQGCGQRLERIPCPGCANLKEIADGWVYWFLVGLVAVSIALLFFSVGFMVGKR
jgi:hypothetical protein